MTNTKDKMRACCADTSTSPDGYVAFCFQLLLMWSMRQCAQSCSMMLLGRLRVHVVYRGWCRGCRDVGDRSGGLESVCRYRMLLADHVQATWLLNLRPRLPSTRFLQHDAPNLLVSSYLALADGRSTGNR
jgi:hypothetical protein